MEKLTLTMDCEYNIKNGELDKYLKELNGINEVTIEYNEEIFAPIFNITYDRNIISPQVIFLEIEAYLNLHKYPCLISFDKYHTGEVIEYKIKTNICCEFCLKITIEDLFEIDGIVKADCNYEKYIDGKIDDVDIVTFYYDPTAISKDMVEKIVKDLKL